MNVYVNGKLVGTDSINLNTIGNDIYIGRNSRQVTNDPEVFDGQIDDIRIYDRALSVDEIKGLYDLEKTTSH